MDRKYLVVAINIGEIYSGYSFSTIADFDVDPLKIGVYNWVSKYFKQKKDQAPTSILLNAKKEFQSFGFDAEDQYLSSCENRKESDIYFFQHFLCPLKWQREKNGDIFVKPSNRDGQFQLTTIIRHSVSYLKTRFGDELHKQCNDILKEDEILWVVVHPDESNFDLRLILLQAFLDIAVGKENIVLVGEGRAVETFARHIEKHNTDEDNCMSKKGTIILNCTSTQVCPNIVFQKYPNVLTSAVCMSSIVTNIDTIMKKRKGCFMFTDKTDINSRSEFINEIENALRYHHSKQHAGSFNISLPISLLEHMRKHITISWNDGFRLRANILGIDRTVIHEVFKNALKPLIDHLKKEIYILNKETMHKIILVGDFAGYMMTKTVFQDNFPQYGFIVPSNSEMAATIGATIAGHEIQSGKYESRIQNVPKMSIDGTSDIESGLLSKPSCLNNSFSEKPSFEPNMDIASVKGNISDLSFLPDPIRPSKIATKLQDLYEIEYRESLAYFLENGCDDVTSRRLLLQIIQEVYDVCRTQAQAQINTTTQAFHPTVGIDEIKMALPSNVVKPLIEYRRKNALEYLPRLVKLFVQTLPNKMDISNSQLLVCTSFIEKSIECCWLMCVTEPPMLLKFEWNKSEQIDLDELEIEGGDGRYVDSMRWPPLYLYENGPLMNKGVVNAK